MIRVKIHLKILYSNFLFIHHTAKVGLGFYIVKTAIQVEIYAASCLKYGAFFQYRQICSLNGARYTRAWIQINVDHKWTCQV